ncbi:MAG: cyclase family protein [Clostridiales bacterium]|nr:cyclase family protein [Clostridiales bacterium]
MEIFDITQELFSCQVYPGDPSPSMERVMSIPDGDICNLTSFSMCAHNGTHVDAPFHFIDDGKTIDQIKLKRFVGPCFVTRCEGDLIANDAYDILDRAKAIDGDSHDPCYKRILIAGDATVTESAAEVFADHRIYLIGNESQTVGPLDAPAKVHYILLGAKVVLLEGIRLQNIDEGKYFLCAQPLNLGGCDGAPVRAILIR